MHAQEKERTELATRSKSQEIYRSIAVGAVMLLGIVGVERIAHGEDKCIRTETTVPYPDFAACANDLFGLDIDTISN